ncbi:MAG: thiosulfate oxidation carrier protein SoxY [Gemmatimonadales bacterium]
MSQGRRKAKGTLELTAGLNIPGVRPTVLTGPGGCDDLGFSTATGVPAPVSPPIERRSFLQTVGALGLALTAEKLSGASSRVAAAIRVTRAGPDDPEVPNEVVRRILAERFQNRPIRRGHVTLDMPALAEDGRFVPVLIETDLPMTPAHYVKGVFLIVDHNPDPLVTAFHLTPALGPVVLETRIKMKRTSWIRAIAETNTGEVWADYLKVETTLNGCG